MFEADRVTRRRVDSFRDWNSHPRRDDFWRPAPNETDDQLLLGEGMDSVVIDTISDSAEAFTPVFCVEGLDLGGVLDFTSS